MRNRHENADENREHDGKNDRGDTEENRLVGVEADSLVLVVGTENQEDDPGDEAEQIAERAGSVLSETRRLCDGLRRCAVTCAWCAAGCVSRRRPRTAAGDLCAAIR